MAEKAKSKTDVAARAEAKSKTQLPQFFFQFFDSLSK
jgi:hypothetical protein